MAVCWTIQQVDVHYTKFTAGKDHAPWEAPKGYEHRKSNFWCDVLVKQAETASKTGIYEVTREQAQALANLGYVVIGAWKNMTLKGYPHYVTVRPWYIDSVYDTLPVYPYCSWAIIADMSNSAHSSFIRPSSNVMSSRYGMVMNRPVAATPWKSPVCVQVMIMRTAASSF
jgi:hypothetical protein